MQTGLAASRERVVPTLNASVVFVVYMLIMV